MLLRQQLISFQTSHWSSTGRVMGSGSTDYIPAGAVSRRVTLCIQASLSGDYQLPDDGVLVSRVYWLSLHPHIEEFEKHATISLQHCAAEDDDSSVSFVTAKCTQETLPYTFKPLSGGAFSTYNSTIQVTGFSGFGILGKRRMYDFRVYYIPKKPNECDVHITLTTNLELHQTVRVMSQLGHSLIFFLYRGSLKSTETRRLAFPLWQK